jgi:putative redox protein
MGPVPTHKSVQIEHLGGMHFHAVPSSGHPYDFDDRESNLGGSPVETVLAALATCSAMDVISLAMKKRQRVVTYRVHVEGMQRDAYPQVFPEITVTHEVIGPDVDAAAISRCVELSATKYCPVNAMLSAGATVVHHRIHVVDTGATPSEVEAEVIATGPYARPDIIAD